jgi:hypothetical protein
MGDSKLITNWMCGSVPFQNLGLQAFMNQVNSWRAHMAYVSFKLIYREHNSLADFQSKAGVNAQLGLLNLSEIKDGVHSTY